MDLNNRTPGEQEEGTPGPDGDEEEEGTLGEEGVVDQQTNAGGRSRPSDDSGSSLGLSVNHHSMSNERGGAIRGLTREGYSSLIGLPSSSLIGLPITSLTWNARNSGPTFVPVISQLALHDRLNSVLGGANGSSFARSTRKGFHSMNRRTRDNSEYRIIASF